MSQIIVQDVRPPRTSSERLEDYRLLRPCGGCTVQGWVCGCVEGGVLRSGRCSKGSENVLKRWLAEVS